MTLNSDQKVLTLTITGDPDGTGTRDARFEMPVGDQENGLQVVHELRTGFLAQGGGNINALIQALTGSGESKNKQVVVEGGDSQYALDASFRLFGGSGHRWGDTGNGGTATDATGDSAIEQIQVLMYWLRTTSVDSLPENLAGDVTGSYGPAQLEYGAHHPDGPLDPVDVAIENPQFTPEPTDRAQGQMTLIEIINLDTPLTSKNNSKLGTGNS
jgi:hypothetical protein